MFFKIIENTQIFQEFIKIFIKKGNTEHRIHSNSKTLSLLLTYLSYRKTGINTYYLTYSPFELEDSYNMLLNIFRDEKIFCVGSDEHGNINPADIYKLYSNDKPKFVIIPFENNFKKVPTIDTIQRMVIHLEKLERFDSKALFSYLKNNKYRRIDAVWENGDFTQRGEIIDIYPYETEYPIRIELNNDIIENMYYFLPHLQEKMDEIKTFVLFPKDFGENAMMDLYKIYDKNDVVIIDNIEKVQQRLKFLMKEGLLEKRNEPIEKFLIFTQKRCAIKIYGLFESVSPDLDISVLKLRNINNIEFFAKKFEEWLSDNYKIVIFSKAQRIDNLKKIIENLDKDHLRDKNNIIYSEGVINQGFIIEREKLVLVSENDLRTKRAPPKEGVQINIDKELKNINTGDYIVHEDYGIGRFVGISLKKIAQTLGDYFEIEYKNNERLFLPVERAYKIHKYITGKDFKPSLDSLRSDQWINKKKKTIKSLEKMLVSIAKLYAEREIKRGYEFSKDDRLHKAFENDFTFEETKDQIRAIEEINRDMESKRPMDRLLVGDVGFGKTEIAMRAAFKAVYDAKQVAVLVPTTVLCEQHFITFKNRFEDYGIKVEMLSRTVEVKKQKIIVQKLANKEIDIIIGTHRLLSEDVEFFDLGLLVIDEEHRFGVKAKERIRFLKSEIDTLAMSATPIPRTLYFSLTQIRPMSLIETPPPGRLSIKTYVSIFNSDVLKSAVLEEMKRGGQIFFIHNNIAELERVRVMLIELVSELRILILHGRLTPGEIKKHMLEFRSGEYDLLLATTIIEIGLDMPNVNTIIMNNGENFGLAQLYQLRGRVGRSNKQAYAYIFVSSLEKLNPDAIKRLQALKQVGLGGGYELSRHDLEIRGIGNLFGIQQSGNILNMGLGMYLKILHGMIEKIQKDELIISDVELDIGIKPYIPDNIIRDNIFRQKMYIDIINCARFEDLSDLSVELEKRYAGQKEKIFEIIDYQWIRIACAKAGIRELKLKKGFLIIRSENNSENIYAILKDIFKIDVNLDKNKVILSFPEIGILLRLKNILKKMI